MSTSPLDILCKVAADAESAEPLPPIRAAPPSRLPPLARPNFRLSSSAPSQPGFLSNSLPLEPYADSHPPHAIHAALHSPSAAQSIHMAYPHTLLNPPLPRNLSAPSLGDGARVPQPALEDLYRIPRTPSRNIPVPARAPQALSPPLYSSPPARRPFAAGPLKSVGRAKTAGRRDSYTRFTAEEEAMLMEGVRVYGVGNWKKILNSYRFHWKRTAVDLKDKYRNMTRAKLRRLNASSASDLSSVGSDDGRDAREARAGQGVQGMSPLQSELLSKSIGLGISPVSTANNTPAGSVEERDKVMRR